MHGDGEKAGMGHRGLCWWSSLLGLTSLVQFTKLTVLMTKILNILLPSLPGSVSIFDLLSQPP